MNGSRSLNPKNGYTVLPSPCTPRTYFDKHRAILESLPYSEIERIVSELLRAYQEARTVFLFGNGGSAALSSHLACDLGKGTSAQCHSKRFRAIALTDNLPLLTAWANDNSYDNIFAEQLRNLSAPRDIAFAISGSGNSPNVLRALETARELRNTTIGLTGYLGGKMKALCDYCVVVPSDNMQVIEDFHLSVSHAVFTGLYHQLGNDFRSRAATATSAVQSD